MENQNNLGSMMETALGKVREMVDVNTIVGTPISTADGTTIIPVSKVGFGFGSGGSEFGKENKDFAGGAAGGVNIVPIAFLVIGAQGVKLITVAPPAGTTVDRIVEMLPTMADKVQEILEKYKKPDDQETDEISF